MTICSATICYFFFRIKNPIAMSTTPTMLTKLIACMMGICVSKPAVVRSREAPKRFWISMLVTASARYSSGLDNIAIAYPTEIYGKDFKIFFFIRSSYTMLVLFYMYAYALLRSSSKYSVPPKGIFCLMIFLPSKLVPE